jgi:RimJ/RimL family protein N-acetyltransferase
MFARTERLTLRPGWIEDAPALHAAVADEAVVRNLASLPWPYRLADAETWLSREGDPHRGGMLIFRRGAAAPELIGVIGLDPGAGGDVHLDSWHLGYWIARPHWGRGYATEAGRAMVALARHSLRLERLSSAHFLDNPASGRVLRKLGFRPTGEVRTLASRARRRRVASAVYTLDLVSEIGLDCDEMPEARGIAA